MRTQFLLSLIALFFTITTISAQEKFKNANLALIENIAYNVKYDNTISLLKKMNYKLTDEKKYSFGHFYHFKNGNGTLITIYYDKNQSLENVSINLPIDAIDLVQTELEEYKFAWTKEDNGFSSGVRWRKKAYPFNYYFKDTDEEESSIMLYVN